MLKKTVLEQYEIDSVNVGLAVLDQAGNVTLINRYCCDLLGKERHELLGKNWFELGVPADKRDEAIWAFQSVMAGKDGLLQLFENPPETISAEGGAISWRNTVLRDGNGRIEGALCLGEDVTKYRQAEQALRINSEEQDALNAILRIGLEDVPLVQQFERVLDIILALSWLPIEPKGGIFQVEGTEEVLTLKAQRGLDPELLTACARVPFGYCLCGRAAASREIQYASCLNHRHDIFFEGMKPHGHYNVPIVSRRGVLGVIVLYLQHGHARQDREMGFLGSVANTLAGMIEHRLVQEALETSRTKLEKTQRIAQLGGWEWVAFDNGFHLSENTYRLLNMPPSAEAMSLETALSIIHPEDRKNFSQAFTQSATQGSPLDIDYRVRLQNGQELMIHSQAEAVFDAEGGVIWLAGMLQDITQRKQAEEKLRLSAIVFENTAEGVMITDCTGRIISANKAFSEITGYGQEELIGKTGSILKSGRHDEQFYAAMWGEIRVSGHWQGEIWNRRKNGDTYPEWLTISAVKDEHGEVTHYVGVFSDISALKESESKLDHLAHHDPLTGLPNRLLLNARTEHSLSRARRNNSLLAILFLDLDHFKNINDTLGHPVGDLLLQETAQRLVACVREEDTVSRLGGDEFTILLEDLSDSRFASTIAQKINTSLLEKFVLQGHEVFISCSIGISIFPNDGNDVTTLFKNADSALYRAKDQGRNNYQYYTDELTTRALERLRMETNLRHALERNELVVHYQPQVDLYSGNIIGMEALLRWNHPEIGLIPPANFIPLAEETGLIIPIGEWVLRTACACLKAWLDEGLPKIRVAVNLSSRQFNQKDLAEIIASVLHDTGLPPECLELELTESLIMHDAENTIIILEKIKALGVQFSIDDFGTGYSSLSYLKRFPIDRIKIDQSFVRNITSEPKDAAVSQAIISMSHSLNLKTVAEGVETAEQQEFLRSRDCDEIQGFHFSRPVPEQEMKRLLKEGFNISASQPKRGQAERVLLLLDDEENVLEALTRVFNSEGYRILRATRPGDALDVLATNQVGVIIADQRMPEMTGMELLQKIRKLYPNTVRVMLTAYADQKTATDAINEGAVYKFISKPWDDDQLRVDIREAFRHQGVIAQTNSKVY